VVFGLKGGLFLKKKAQIGLFFFIVLGDCLHFHDNYQVFGAQPIETQPL
jgi:hypothetical protein